MLSVELRPLKKLLRYGLIPIPRVVWEPNRNDAVQLCGCGRWVKWSKLGVAYRKRKLAKLKCEPL